ncbi:MAG: hypothetical protein ABSB63_03445 [Spirochaetia bacterium]
MKTHISKTPMMKLAAVVLLGALCIVFTGCFYMPGLRGGSAKAGISVNRSLLPANVSSVALIVGGPGMETITAQYPVGTTTATLTVPSGAARTFTILANTPSVTFGDNVTADLAPNETKVVDLTPTLTASQIIVPDYLNNQIVQVSDMKGTGWTTLIDDVNGLYPYDVDFDAQGRIYIADPNRGILWTEDITGPFSPLTGVYSPYNIYSIAMDRVRGLLYYVYSSEGCQLRRIQVTSGLDELVDLGSQGVYLNNVQGIAVDSDGFVYIANNSPGEVLKINPNPDPLYPTLMQSYSSTLSYPYDVLVNGNYIYVSDPGDIKIVRLTKDLTLVDSFSGPASDPLGGPERFVAILNKPITVIDEGGSGGDRIVSFNDMTGAGWRTYGSTGSGEGQFEFYNSMAY